MRQGRTGDRGRFKIIQKLIQAQRQEPDELPILALNELAKQNNFIFEITYLKNFGYIQSLVFEPVSPDDTFFVYNFATNYGAEAS